MIHVSQEDGMGCGVACLAMLTGASYGDVRRAFSDNSRWTDGGLTYSQIFTYLAWHGYAVAHRLYRAGEYPEPFADVCLCHVYVDAGCTMPHWVVMLRDGSVLDPASTSLHRLTDYPRVISVSAVVAIGQAERVAAEHEEGGQG